MNDQFLNSLRQDPPPVFARRLKSQLQILDAPVAAEPRSPAWRWLATAATVVALAFAFTLPVVRSAAEAFLDYFRVVNFAGVAFDPQRVAQLWSNASIDLPALIGSQVEAGPPPALPVAYSTLDEAGAAAGMRLSVPAWLPQGFTQSSIEVRGAHEFSVKADTEKLQTVLNALDIADVSIPAGLDGQVVSVRVPPVARILFNGEGPIQATLVQSKTPVISFPAGVDLASLAEIGLRLLGLERAEAYRFAQSIDWRSTLLVPVPAVGATFHQVEVQNGTGLVIEAGPRPGGRGDGGSVVLWSNGDTVYALAGSLRATDALQMAQSVQ